MSEVIKIKKGLDIRLQGKAEDVFIAVSPSDYFAVKPTDFPHLVPKMIAKVGDSVQVGSVLFVDKKNPQIKVLSPVSGVLHQINRGDKRVIQEVVIQSDGKMSQLHFTPKSVASLSREQIIDHLLEGGMWPFIRQRPYSIIAKPTDNPKAIFISGFNSAPLSPDVDFIVNGHQDLIQVAIDVLKKLTNGKVYIGLNADAAGKTFASLKGVEIKRFEGPHPVGNVGVQIHHVEPINKGEVVWTVQPQDLIAIGNLFLKGFYDSSRIFLVAGSEVKKPAYMHAVIGSSIQSLIKNNLKEGNVRIISGNILSGSTVETDGYIGFYDSQLTVIPEGKQHEFLGWALPGLNKFSVSRTFFSWLTPEKTYQLNTNQHGGERAFVMTGEYDRVFPFDIYPVFLLKAIIAKDIDAMEQLGIYEVAPEDFALCEFVCTSKIDVQQIVREGIDLMISELG